MNEENCHSIGVQCTERIGSWTKEPTNDNNARNFLEEMKIGRNEWMISVAAAVQ